MSTGATARDAREGDPALSPLTIDTVRELLADRRIFPGVPTELGEDTELILDSLGLVWLLHVVEERFGLVVEPTHEEITGFTSLRRLAGYLRAAQMNQADQAGRPEGGGHHER